MNAERRDDVLAIRWLKSDILGLVHRDYIIINLSIVQKLTILGIMQVLRNTQKAALETLLNLYFTSFNTGRRTCDQIRVGRFKELHEIMQNKCKMFGACGRTNTKHVH